MVVCLLMVQNAAGQPPVAYLEAKPISIYACGIIEIDGSRSVDPDGQVVSWKWSRIKEGKEEEIGSGKKLILEWPYTREVGSYEIKLTVTDNEGSSDSKTVTVWIKENKKPRISRIENTGLNNSIVFEGEKFTLKAIIEPDTDDDPLTWQWSYNGKIFNFSNAEIANPEVKAVSSPEIYETYHNLGVQVTDSCGQKDFQEIKIGTKRKPYRSPPEAVMTIPDVIRESESFTVDGVKSKGDFLQYQWWWRKYGDNKTLGSASGEKATLRFSDGGVAYELFLNVTDSYGSNTASAVIFVQETEDDKPGANAGATMKNVIVGQIFILNASLSADDRDFMDRGIQTYIWEISAVFNGTSWSEEIQTKKPVIEHQFLRVGEYTVKLTVRDGSFQEDSDTIKIIAKVFEGKPEIKPEVSANITPAVPTVTPSTTRAAAKGQEENLFSSTTPRITPTATPKKTTEEIDVLVTSIILLVAILTLLTVYLFKKGLIAKWGLYFF